MHTFLVKIDMVSCNNLHCAKNISLTWFVFQMQMHTWASSMVTWRGADLAEGGSSNGPGCELRVDLLPGTPQLLLNHFHGHLAVKAGHLHGPCVSPHGAAYSQLQGGWAMPDTALGNDPADAISGSV